MASLKNIKLKIASVKKTRQVTKAMEAVSAVKMRKTQEQALRSRAYAVAALSMLKRLATSADLAHAPLFASIPDAKTCFIIITSDKGLAGALNSSVIRKAETEMRARGLAKQDIVIIAIGRRGADYFANRGYDVRSRMENVSDDVEEVTMSQLTKDVLSLRTKKETSTCAVIYTNFMSTFEQEAVVREVLPLNEEMLEEMVRGIAPLKGKYADERVIVPPPEAYAVEPSADEVLAEMMPKLLSVALFHALVEAKASEHSSRMVAMKNATDKAGEVAHELTLVFNKARQSAITAEVSEITSGMESVK